MSPYGRCGSELKTRFEDGDLPGIAELVGPFRGGVAEIKAYGYVRTAEEIEAAAQ
ncbi:MAG: hypothetical protein QGH29_00530 [Kiritimatiellia bacterium]|nr:hypothetical protein [Kiritimatiellia bacterium]